MKRASTLLACLLLSTPAAAVEVEGLLDLRLQGSNSEHGWLWQGLDKQRFDDRHDGLQLGQAVLEIRGQPLSTVNAVLVLLGRGDGGDAVQASEAFLQWRPVPDGAWRPRVKLGAFFPAISEENTGLGWTAPRTISTSAVNAWIGEEFRTVGAELTYARPGRFVGSAHDIELFAAVFGYNDPAGALLVWRGWSVGDRISIAGERIDFADLPAFRPTGVFRFHAPWIKPFKEIDGRWGAYAGARYRHARGWGLSLMRYDNRGDPSGFDDGQWSWMTRFWHLGANWQPRADWEVLAQLLQGSTVAGRRHSVAADYRAGYLLLSHLRGAHRFSVRFDAFAIDDRDRTVSDPNGEHGNAQALAWVWSPPGRAWHIALEWLRIDSTRDNRVLIGEPSKRVENSLSAAWRWRF
ncbi:MAG TPA: hypothetical protein VFY12_12685 [Arenimonas sp.]|nr:hypothetical protein [Arenimonas sp.]